MIKSSQTMDIAEDNIVETETVQERRLKWMLNEDKALAEQLQTREFSEHYKHNKCKNAQLREDLDRAKHLAKEIDEKRNLQIKKDERIAKELSRKLEESILQEQRDEELARNLQELEINEIQTKK